MSTKRTVHGIDLTAPGGLAELLEHHRATFGDARMMADGDGAGEGGAGAEGAGSSTEGGNGSTNTEAGIQHDGPPAPKPADKTESKPAEWDGKVESLPADAQKIIRDLRKEDGDERVAAKTLAAIQKALNPDKGEGEKPDAEQLVKDLTTQQDETRRAQTELAVYRAAGKHGADPDALLDSRTFLAKIKDIDPTNKADIEKAIQDAVNDSPKLKATRAVGKSGTDFNGGPGETGKKEPLPLRDAVASHYSA